MSVSICDRNHAGLVETQNLIHGISSNVEVLVNEVDMLQEEVVDTMVNRTVEKWGRLDYTVNATGIMGSNDHSTSTSSNQFDMINSINYPGSLAVFQHRRSSRNRFRRMMVGWAIGEVLLTLRVSWGLWGDRILASSLYDMNLIASLGLE